MIDIACIVEGHGDVSALPILIRRIAQSFDTNLGVNIPEPIRVPRHTLTRPGELERHVILAATKVGERGGLIVLIDSDDDCPATTGPDLLARVRATCAHLPSAVVLAKREFEAWFLAGAESLRGKRALPNDLLPPPDPEAVRGAKEWLRNRMPPGRKYRETVDQPALSAVVDLNLAARSPSFAKLQRDVVRICRELAAS
jgi:hypothetical protein